MKSVGKKRRLVLFNVLYHRLSIILKKEFKFLWEEKMLKCHLDTAVASEHPPTHTRTQPYTQLYPTLPWLAGWLFFGGGELHCDPHLKRRYF